MTQGHEQKETLGSILKNARSERGWSQDYVADSLKIRVQWVREIEADDLSNLPGWAYAQGIVGSYARLLGVDKNSLPVLPKPQNLVGVQRASSTSGATAFLPELSSDLIPEKAQQPIWLYVLLGLGFIGAGCAGWYFYLPQHGHVNLTPNLSAPAISTSQEPQTPVADAADIAPVLPEPTVTPAESQEQPLVSSVNTDNRDAAPVAPPAVQDPVTPNKVPDAAISEKGAADQTAQVTPVPQERGFLTIVAKQPSWVTVKNADNQVIFNQLLKQDMVWKAPVSDATYIVTVGNAGGLDVTLANGRKLALGAEGVVRRGVKIAPDGIAQESDNAQAH